MNSETITVNERMVTAKELTVEQVRDIIGDTANQRSLSLIELLFVNDIPAIAIEKSTGITVSELENGNFTPSDIEKIIEVVKAVNPLFSAAVARLSKIGEKVLQDPNLTELLAG